MLNVSGGTADQHGSLSHICSKSSHISEDGRKAPRNKPKLWSWGMEGAAIATSITLLLWNLLLAKVVFEKFGIISWAFGNVCRSGNTG